MFKIRDFIPHSKQKLWTKYFFDIVHCLSKKYTRFGGWLCLNRCKEELPSM